MPVPSSTFSVRHLFCYAPSNLGEATSSRQSDVWGLTRILLGSARVRWPRANRPARCVQGKSGRSATAGTRRRSCRRSSAIRRSAFPGDGQSPKDIRTRPVYSMKLLPYVLRVLDDFLSGRSSAGRHADDGG